MLGLGILLVVMSDSFSSVEPTINSATSILFSVFLFLLPTPTHARTTTYIGNYEVTTEDNGLKKEVVRGGGKGENKKEKEK